MKKDKQEKQKTKQQDNPKPNHLNNYIRFKQTDYSNLKIKAQLYASYKNPIKYKDKDSLKVKQWRNVYHARSHKNTRVAKY